MPMYYRLRRWKKADRIRTIDRILGLRRQLERDIPERTVSDTLLLATWNIRDFDSNKFGHGPRIPETFHYIAEIISAFDLVAVQEVNRDLKALERVMDILGPNWTYISTDVTEGRSGNNERMTFVFDTRKVLFRNIAGEIVLPKNLLIGEERQFARTPFSVKFQSGWFQFDLCTVHLYYGASSGAGYERRVKEIGEIARFMAKRAEREGTNVILLGDMNVVGPNDATIKALKKHGFVVPGGLALTTNMLRNKYYDRDELELGPSDRNAGVFEMYRSVYRSQDCETYYPLGKKNGKWPSTEDERKKYFAREWRTWQMSDHLPLFVELKIDFTEKYLAGVKDGR